MTTCCTFYLWKSKQASIPNGHNHENEIHILIRHHWEKQKFMAYKKNQNMKRRHVKSKTKIKNNKKVYTGHRVLRTWNCAPSRNRQPLKLVSRSTSLAIVVFFCFVPFVFMLWNIFLITSKCICPQNECVTKSYPLYPEALFRGDAYTKMHFLLFVENSNHFLTVWS